MQPTVAALRNRAVWRWVAFPAAVLIAFLVLVGLNLNGSSIAILSTDRPGLVAGTPRPIRSDEWVIQTPVAVSSVAQDFPASPWIGLTPTDQAAAAHGGPTTDWTEIFKPQDWGYLLLGASHGLAVSWWWSYVISLWGCFALLGLLTRRPLLSSLLAVGLTFTPYAGWWSAPAPALFLGYAAMTGACLIAAWTARRRWLVIACSVSAGMFAVALALALYPPWQVSLGWVLAAVCVGHALDARVGWRRFFVSVGVSLVVAGGIAGAWFLQNRAAIQAQADTLYPGHRISAAGDGSLAVLVDAPLNFWMTHSTGATLGLAGRIGPAANLSEAASTWLPLPVLAVLVVGILELLGRRLLARGSTAAEVPAVREAVEPASAPDIGEANHAAQVTAQTDPRALAGRAPLWTLGLVAAVFALLLCWTVLPVPAFIGKITQLQRVEPVRTPLALGFAAVILIAAASRVRGRRPLAWHWAVLVIAVVLTAVMATWSAGRLPWDDNAVSRVLVLFSGLAIGAVFAGLMRSRAVALGAAFALAAYAVLSWLPINPLQHGIEPIAKDQLVRKLKSVTKGTENPRVAVFASMPNNFPVVAKVRAAGLQSLTGTTFYPNAPLMHALVPAQQRLWNNYAQFRWVAAAPGTAPSIKQIHGTAMQLTIPVCDPVLLAKARPGWVVSETRLTAGCLVRVAVSKSRGKPVWIYRVASGN